MSRHHLTFACEGAQLLGTLDEGRAQAGLLMVSGGNELRAGAWNGQAQLAARIAGEGFPVFRFDRRGTGDSSGPNGDFRTSAPDIAAACDTLRALCPALTRVVGLGNCDAASALMLVRGAGLDALALSNPWTFDETEGANADEADAATAMPPEAVRAHYRRRLADPAALRRVLRGEVSLRKLAKGLAGALRPAPPPSSLVQAMAAGLGEFPGEVVFLLAERDRTAQAFLAAWDKDDPRIRTCPDATHSFVEAHARDWLAEQVLTLLRA